MSNYAEIEQIDSELQKIYAYAETASPANKSKITGLVKRLESKRKSLVTRTTKLDTTIANMEKQNTKRIKDSASSFTERYSNKANNLLAAENNPKDKIAVLNKLTRETMANLGPTDQVLRDAIYKEQANLMKIPGMAWDKDRPSERNSYNVGGGEIVSTTAGLQDKPFFKDFDNASLRQITKIAENALGGYAGGKINLDVLEQAIKETDGASYGFDSDDTTFSSDGTYGIDNSAMFYSDSKFENDVKRNYLRVYNRAMSSDILKGKSRAAQKRIKAMSEEYKKMTEDKK